MDKHRCPAANNNRGGDNLRSFSAVVSEAASISSHEDNLMAALRFSSSSARALGCRAVVAAFELAALRARVGQYEAGRDLLAAADLAEPKTIWFLLRFFHGLKREGEIEEKATRRWIEESIENIMKSMTCLLKVLLHARKT